jgi:hypothetical protein
MPSVFPIRRGIEEFLLCRRKSDAGASALRFTERAAALKFVRSCITNRDMEHKLRQWIMADPQPNMSLEDDDDLFDHVAARIATGLLSVAKVEVPPTGGPASGEGILRPEGSAPAKSKKSAAKKESTAREDEDARRANAAAEEAEEVDLAEEEAAQTEEKTWIEIELVDPSGYPASNERYKLTLPDGSIKWGRLDRDGRARVEKLQPGSCQVTFPDRDEESWEIA